MRTQVVILAGGQGTRFWPISRTKHPKQFLSIREDGESLISATARRVAALSPQGAPWIVANTMHETLVREHVPNAVVLCEPVGRNTAPSIAYAAMRLAKVQPDAVMVVLPADHAISDEEKLRVTLANAVALASAEELLVTIGIEPSWPNTGYGYIKRGAKLAHSGYMVSRFFEKPNEERAKSYLESKQFFWNSGMFVWRVDAILAAIREYMPELYGPLAKIEPKLGTPEEAQALTEVFPALESVSIDIGVLEHARNCAVVEAESFGWNDVGSWDAWAQHFEKDSEGNLQHGDTLLVDSTDSVVYSPSRFAAVIGVENLVVIDSGDALLVCPRSRVQDVRRIVEHLKQRGRTELM